jgi:hypothetical protein
VAQRQLLCRVEITQIVEVQRNQIPCSQAVTFGDRSLKNVNSFGVSLPAPKEDAVVVQGVVVSRVDRLAIRRLGQLVVFKVVRKVAEQARQMRLPFGYRIDEHLLGTLEVTGLHERQGQQTVSVRLVRRDGLAKDRHRLLVTVLLSQR